MGKKQKNMQIQAMVIIAAGMAGVQPTMADDMHMDAANPCSMKHHSTMKGKMAGMEDAFLEQKQVDGYTVSFHIMKAPKDMQHGGSHHVMIKVEKGGKIFTDIIVNSKVTHPNGESESKMMTKMGDWYMAGYDLVHPGPHQVMVLFKMTDGSKHFTGIDFPAP